MRLETLVEDVTTRIQGTPISEGIEKFYVKNIEQVINAAYDEYFKEADISERLVTLRRDLFKRRKQRWISKAIKDYKEKKIGKKPGELIGEYLFFTQHYELNPNLLQQAMSPEQIIEKKIHELEQWYEDDSKSLSSYVYLLQRTKKQVQSAILVDVALKIGEFLLEEEEKEHVIQPLLERPLAPIFGATRGNVLLKNADLIGNTYKAQTVLQDGTEYEIAINSSYIDKSKNSVGDLDDIDDKIFLEVMRHRDERFVKHKLVVVKIFDIMKSIYKTTNSKTFKLIEDRLVKMAYFTLTHHSHTGERRVFGVFSEVNIVKQPDGTRIAEIYVSESIYQSYLQKQTVLMYKDKVDLLSQGLSKQLIFVLQKERLAYLDKTTTYTVKMDFTYLSGVIRFRKKTIRENIKDIERALEELITQKILIKSFIRKRHTFHIECYPLDKREEKDFLTFENDDVTNNFALLERDTIV